MTFTDNYNWGNVNCYYWSDSNTKDIMAGKINDKVNNKMN